MAQKSKILIIGGTGYIGKYIVEESAKAGHPTFALVRENAASNPEKSKLIESFHSSGVTLLHGDIYHHESLVKAIKQVDVVISALGSPEQIADQRFLPSEFGGDVDRIHAVEPIEHHFWAKASIRRSIEAEGVPYTTLFPMAFLAPPRDKVEIIGDGNTKVIFSKEEDIATSTIKAVDDPRTLNKVLHVRPPANILSFNEIVSLWEKKIGKTLEKTYLLEDQLLKKIQGCSNPLNLLLLSIAHSTFVKGNFETSRLRLLMAWRLQNFYPELNQPAAAATANDGEVSIRIIGAAEQEHDREPAAGLVVGHQLGSDVAAAARTDVSPQAAEAQGGDSRIERGGVAEGISQSANGNTEGEAVDGGGANGRDSSYQRYDIQQAARWIEQVLPFSLLLLVVFIRQHLQGRIRKELLPHEAKAVLSIPLGHDQLIL
nr:isoflavone reductase-like protein [Quercus suber]